MKVELMDKLDELEYLQTIANDDIKNGNYYGGEKINFQIATILDGLGLNRRVARDLGWDL